MNFSMSVADVLFLRFKSCCDADTSSASSLGIDISAFYQSEIFKMSSNSALIRSGINISNIGPRLNYESGTQKLYSNKLETGCGLDILFDDDNILGFYAEFSKLLVPTPVVYDSNQNLLGYKQPDIDFINGIFRSFSDAPGGLSEESVGNNGVWIRILLSRFSVNKNRVFQ